MVFSAPQEGLHEAQGTLGVVVPSRRPRTNAPTAQPLDGGQQPPAPRPASPSPARAAQGLGRVSAADLFPGDVPSSCRRGPWRNRSPRPAALRTRLPSVAARTRTPAPRWAQNLLLASWGPQRGAFGGPGRAQQLRLHSHPGLPRLQLPTPPRAGRSGLEGELLWSNRGICEQIHFFSSFPSLQPRLL